MTKRKKAILEDELIKKAPQPFKFVLTILKFYTKEFLLIIIIVLIGLWILFNLSWDSEHGIQIKPGIKAEINKSI